MDDLESYTTNQIRADEQKVWTSVGSAGTLNHDDLAKVSLHRSIVQLGTEISGTSLRSAAAPSAVEAPLARIGFPTIQAVVRYNVVPVAGLFRAPNFAFCLQLRCRGHVIANLFEVDLASGAESVRVLLDTSTIVGYHSGAGFTVQTVPETLTSLSSVPMDFVGKAYYVEATLVASAVIIGDPAAISIVKVLAQPPFIN
jgi:hypothetical protein